MEELPGCGRNRQKTPSKSDEKRAIFDQKGAFFG
jgi:hypothetical protein